MDFLIEFLRAFGAILGMIIVAILGLVLFMIAQPFGPIVSLLVMCVYIAFCVTLIGWILD